MVTTFQYIGSDYSNTVTAGGSWSAAGTSITLASATLPTNIAAALAAGYEISVTDTTTGQFVGTISTVVGTTLTLRAGAVYASSAGGTGTSDSPPDNGPNHLRHSYRRRSRPGRLLWLRYYISNDSLDWRLMPFICIVSTTTTLNGCVGR